MQSQWHKAASNSEEHTFHTEQKGQQTPSNRSNQPALLRVRGSKHQHCLLIPPFPSNARTGGRQISRKRGQNRNRQSPVTPPRDSHQSNKPIGPSIYTYKGPARCWSNPRKAHPLLEASNPTSRNGDGASEP
jgi:hypothetical protein